MVGQLVGFFMPFRSCSQPADYATAREARRSAMKVIGIGVSLHSLAPCYDGLLDHFPKLDIDFCLPGSGGHCWPYNMTGEGYAAFSLNLFLNRIAIAGDLFAPILPTTRGGRLLI